MQKYRCSHFFVKITESSIPHSLQKIFPEKISTLEKHREEYFTNDMFYDTFCGIINAKSNRYDAGQDFSADEYKFTRETLTTMLGQHKLTEDEK